MKINCSIQAIMVIISMIEIEYLYAAVLIPLAIKGFVMMCRGENVFSRRRH